MFREDEQQLIIDSNSFINLFVDFPSTLDVIRSVPASNTFALEGVVKSCGECFVLMGITDEAGIELDRLVK